MPTNLSPLAAATARTKLGVSLVVGLVAVAVTVAVGSLEASPLVGWDALVIVFTTWTWLAVWPLDAAQTKTHAIRENPSRGLADAILLVAALVSLAAVGVVLVASNDAQGSLVYVEAGFAVLSVVVTWVLVHTVFTLEYARLYYGEPEGGISFNEDDPPVYSDFAYMAFSLGMTYQVSDTDIQTKAIRRVALRQSLIAFPLGTVIIATTINLVSGLVSK